MTTTKRKTTTGTRQSSKTDTAFNRVLGNVESMVDDVSTQLWELTR